MLSCMRGYHIYHLIWYSCIGEIVCYESDRQNVLDQFTVSVKQDYLKMILLLAILSGRSLGCAHCFKGKVVVYTFKIQYP